MRIEPRIDATAATGVQAIIAQCGGDAARVFGAVQLHPAALSPPGTRLSLAAYCQLFEAAARHTGMADFGLRFGSLYRLEDMGPLGEMVLNSPTLGVALQNLCAWFPSLQEHSSLRLSARGPQLALDYQIEDGRITHRRQDAELTIGLLCALLRRALGAGFAPAEVQFEHLRAGPATQLGAPVYYGAARNALLLPRAVLDAPMPGADPSRLPGLAAILRRRLAAAPPADFIGRVLACIRAGLLAGGAPIEAIAAELGLSRTGLYRRLAREGVDFSTLTQLARREMAEFYASQPGIPFTEIALLLGYSELSAFTRAFTRWTGQPPARYRQACQLRK